MRIHPSLLALAAILSALPAAAQNTPPEPGQRVMLVLTHQRDVEGYTPAQVLRGTLTRATADSLTLQLHTGTGPITVARGAVRRTYLSRGVPSRAESAAGGAVVGAVGGALWGWLYNPEDGSWLGTRSDTHAALIGAGMGGGFGMVMGALFPRERWKRVRAPKNVALTPASTPEGHGVALNFRI
ncbi:MAG TPA: hypothetical protein VFJ82_02265 [Longimicrobium sp.]|nr:hypothetical protein [Longimicrobium sp.]